MEKKMREEIIIYGMLYITFLLWNYQISYILAAWPKAHF